MNGSRIYQKQQVSLRSDITRNQSTGSSDTNANRTSSSVSSHGEFVLPNLTIEESSVVQALLQVRQRHRQADQTLLKLPNVVRILESKRH
jgi:hypothetical protein